MIRGRRRRGGRKIELAKGIFEVWIALEAFMMALSSWDQLELLVQY